MSALYSKRDLRPFLTSQLSQVQPQRRSDFQVMLQEESQVKQKEFVSGLVTSTHTNPELWDQIHKSVFKLYIASPSGERECHAGATDPCPQPLNCHNKSLASLPQCLSKTE